ncbi:TPA: Rab family GTPase [Legionella anisa]
MKLRTAFFKQQLDFLQAVYALVEKHYGVLDSLNAENFPNDAFAQIKLLQNRQQQFLAALHQKLKKITLNSTDTQEYLILGEEIMNEIGAQLEQIIDLTCPENTHKQHKHSYSQLTALVFNRILHEENKTAHSLVSKFMSTVKNTKASILKNFHAGLQPCIMQLSTDIYKLYQTQKRDLAPRLSLQLSACHIGYFKHVPHDILNFIQDNLDDRSLCKLSEAGQFFNKFTEETRKNRSAEAYQLALSQAPKIQITLIGDLCIGKKNLIFRLTNRKFNSLEAIIAPDTLSHLCKTKTGNFLLNYTSVREQQGVNRYNYSYYRGSRVFVLCFDISDRISFNNLRDWLSEAKRFRSMQLEILVATKCDSNERVVDYQEALDFAESYGMTYVETSALTNKGLELLEERIIECYQTQALDETYRPGMRGR